MREVTPTRSSALELADERRLMRQGYEFLDEKRMLLATEMLRQLKVYQQLSHEFTVQLQAAASAMSAAVQRHGFDNLQVYPVPAKPLASPASDRTLFLGIPLLAVRPPADASATAPPAIDPSPETLACQLAFERLLQAAADIGVRAGNLSRLAREFRRTERRAKALENVLLPEVDDAIKHIDEQLETMDREESIRARWSSKTLGRI